MYRLTQSTAGTIVVGALDQKYGRLGAEAIDLETRAAWQSLAAKTSEFELLAMLSPTDGLTTDIANHLIVLRLIDEFWSSSPIDHPISSIRRAVYGHPNTPPTMRSARHVADFGGVVPTPAEDAKGALDELELIVERLTPTFNGRDTDAQATFLAHLFSSIIRVHPFEDGNGRTARMVVQYCLRCWDRPFLALPKVRNSNKWRIALAHAIDGNQTMLVRELRSRLDSAISALLAKK